MLKYINILQMFEYDVDVTVVCEALYSKRFCLVLVFFGIVHFNISDYFLHELNKKSHIS